MKTNTLTLLLLLFLCFGLFASASASDITTSTATAKAPVTFTFTGIINSDGYALIYYWDWGDTTTSTTYTPQTTHTYTEAGTYTVTLTINGTLNLGEDWDISSDWQTTVGTYVQNIDVAKEDAEATKDNIVNNMYLATTMLSTALIVLAAVLIGSVLRSGEAGFAPMILGVALIISAVITLIVGFTIINGLSGISVT